MSSRHQWFTAGLAAFLLIGVILIHDFIAKPVLASTSDDVRTLTEIAMSENRVTGVNPESIALEESRLADTVTLVTATGLVKHLQKDAFLDHLRKATGASARGSIEVSDVQVNLYGDTAIVTYQKQIKHFESSEGTPVTVPGLTDHPMSFMDTFVKRNGQWKAVATVGVSQSSLPDELYKTVKTEAAQW